MAPTKSSHFTILRASQKSFHAGLSEKKNSLLLLGKDLGGRLHPKILSLLNLKNVLSCAFANLCVNGLKIFKCIPILPYPLLPKEGGGFWLSGKSFKLSYWFKR